MPTPNESLRAAFSNCIDRKCTSEQLQSFLDRARIQWAGNKEMLRTIEELQKGEWK